MVKVFLISKIIDNLSFKNYTCSNKWVKNKKGGANLMKLHGVTVSSQVREAIIDMINSLELMDKLPSETELASNMGVSRNTVREVLKTLENEGLVISRHGIGTFVTKFGGSENIQYNIASLDSTTKIIEMHGYKPGTSDVYFDIRIPDDKISMKLGHDKKEKVLYMERIRTANDKPLVYVEDYVGYEEGMYDEFSNDPNMSLFRFMENYSPVSFSSCSIHAVLSNEKLMKKLKLSQPKALLLLQQIHYSSKGIPVLYSDSYFITEELEFNVIRRIIG